MKDVKNKYVVILGAARSGLAAAHLMKDQGARVFVSESAPLEKKKNVSDRLKEMKIDHEFGGHSEKIQKADFVILSPGIPQTTPVVRKLLSKGIPVYSEIEAASWFCQAPIIAITGSNGKTTTTRLLGEMIRSDYPQSLVAGNIGRAFSEDVGQVSDSDWAVIEVSSFQLETIDSFHPRIVLLLNLAPNHLDWYQDYEAYIGAKMRIMKNLTSSDHLIYNGDDKRLIRQTKNCPAKKYRFSINDERASAFIKNGVIYLEKQEVLHTNQIKLRGGHNYQNIMAALLAARLAGVSQKAMVSVLSSFSGVEHRLEYVTTINGIDFINDSKATTIESLAVALNSFDRPLILIAGGKDKGSDYTTVTKLLAENVRKAILIGTAREKIKQAWKDTVPVESVESLEMAVRTAFDLAQSGQTILLSPACSSYDMFQDYEERGMRFKEIITKLKEHYEHHKAEK